MRNLDPKKITGCIFRQGDTNETLSGDRREFFIGVLPFGEDIDLIGKHSHTADIRLCFLSQTLAGIRAMETCRG